MTLSEAIRLGAMLRPQAFGVKFDGVGTCALGAALDASGALGMSETVEAKRYREWNLNAWFQEATCPECGRIRSLFMEGTIPHLNDKHRWTRERIADWVETIEQQQDQPTAQPDAVKVVA